MKYDLSQIGIYDLSPMQQEMLQDSNKYERVILLSPTGSGKTIAYLLPLIHSLREEGVEGVQALVIVPSRELAIQTRDVVRSMAPTVKVMACYGGRPAMDEHREIKRLSPILVIATPGRCLDHLGKGNFSIANLSNLVIDEFDKSLELGFQEQMMGIMSYVPSDARKVLLSATDSPIMEDFLDGKPFKKFSYLTEKDKEDGVLEEKFVRSDLKDKLECLYALLCCLGRKKSLVFVNYRESVERTCAFLTKKGIKAVSFHGGLEQEFRERALFRFTNGSSPVMVCTDLASRGLDISDVNAVIHYHLPLNEEAYIHRNGRTARWDKVGESFLLLGPEEYIPDYMKADMAEYSMPATIPHPLPPKWVTIYIGKGKKHKISRGDVLGFLIKQGGAEASQIGKIDIFPMWSFVTLERKVASSVLRKIQGLKIKGQKTIFSFSD